jgi:prepilin-type N-terminal cleavage/methylation domain-containing protein
VYYNKNLFNNDVKIKNAFTLIELSIVMVIIGLIIGGILTGQELIHGAGVRGIISQINKFNSATNTFYMKYNALPGDFVNASSYIPGTVFAGNGDGNGLIGGLDGPSTPVSVSPGAVLFTASAEYQNFWSHMSAINIIEGSYPIVTGLTAIVSVVTNFPATKLNSNVGFVVCGNTGDYINYYYIEVSSVNPFTNPSGASINFLSPGDAFAIDNKIDDGNPIAGIVAARAGSIGFEQNPTITSSATLSSANVSSCLAGLTYGTAPNYYNTAATTSNLLCQLRVRVN